MLKERKGGKNVGGATELVFAGRALQDLKDFSQVVHLFF